MHPTCEHPKLHLGILSFRGKVALRVLQKKRRLHVIPVLRCTLFTRASFWTVVFVSCDEREEYFFFLLVFFFGEAVSEVLCDFGVVGVVGRRRRRTTTTTTTTTSASSSSSSKAFNKSVVDRKSDAEMAGPVYHREKRLSVRQKCSRRRRRRRRRGEEEQRRHKNSRLRASAHRRRFGGFHERVKRD